jgi:type III secretory pathway component EscV
MLLFVGDGLLSYINSVTLSVTAAAVRRRFVRVIQLIPPIRGRWG